MYSRAAVVTISGLCELQSKLLKGGYIGDSIGGDYEGY